jgi:hypothetical protein
MGGLLDALTGSSTDPTTLYGGGLLSPDQKQAVAYRGLLAAAGALGQAAMPSRMPVPIGAVLGSAASAMGAAQDTGIENAMKARLVGLPRAQRTARPLCPSLAALGADAGRRGDRIARAGSERGSGRRQRRGKLQQWRRRRQPLFVPQPERRNTQ